MSEERTKSSNPALNVEASEGTPSKISDPSKTAAAGSTTSPIVEGSAKVEERAKVDDETPKQELGDEAEEEPHEVVTMVDVLEDETALEEDAKAVLGAADDKNCTYFTGGYMTRQPLYSCLTCIPIDSLKNEREEKDFSRSGGVCLACSYGCHESHELVELYTKRNFRCDCGNQSKFPKSKCKLEEKKNPFNSNNKYNQNFAGVYCICHRPYPDPEDSVSDEMIQCIICEDWYHGRHLGMDKSELPVDNSYAEMICQSCTQKHSFLMGYKEYAVNLKKPNDSVENVDVITPDENKPVECILKENAPTDKVPVSLFLVDGWRNHLCKCQDCDKLLMEQDLEFLKNPEDTVHHYEAKSKSGGSQYEEGMKALSEMDRVKQMEAIQSYNHMKGDLMEYLKKFATNGKVVRQEDIAEFFEKFAANKRRKVEIPKFCR